MTEQQPKIGLKGAGRKITKKLSETRRKPLSKELMNIVNEISEREQKKLRKITHSRLLCQSIESYPNIFFATR